MNERKERLIDLGKNALHGLYEHIDCTEATAVLLVLGQIIEELENKLEEEYD